MNVREVARIRDALSKSTGRANQSLGSFDEGSIGIGRYVPGASPWERHNNGDELLYITDGEVQIEILLNPGESCVSQLSEGSLVVVPRGKWHQLTASNDVIILYISPGEEGAERQRERPSVW